MIKFLLYGTIVLTAFSFYIFGWNTGFNVGIKNAEDTAIIRGKVTCRYTQKP